MTNIRVLIQDAPTMLREILTHAILHEPDMEVVPEPVTSTHAPATLSLSPDVVLLGVSGADPAESARALLHRWPESQVFVITEGGHRTLRYELLPRGVDLGEMSPQQAVQAIRSAVSAQREPRRH